MNKLPFFAFYLIRYITKWNKIMKRVLFLAIVLVALAGCKSKQAAVSAPASLDGEWSIVEMNGNKLDPVETKQVMVFDMNNKTISGNAGCNRISGKIEYNKPDSNIKFYRVIATRMACMDMSYEEELLKTLDKVARFEMGESANTAQSATLFEADGSKLIVIEKRP
jgi:heat shock protein HslJ